MRIADHTATQHTPLQTPDHLIILPVCCWLLVELLLVMAWCVWFLICCGAWCVWFLICCGAWCVWFLICCWAWCVSLVCLSVFVGEYTSLESAAAAARRSKNLNTIKCNHIETFKNYDYNWFVFRFAKPRTFNSDLRNRVFMITTGLYSDLRNRKQRP